MKKTENTALPCSSLPMAGPAERCPGGGGFRLTFPLPALPPLLIGGMLGLPVLAALWLWRSGPDAPPDPVAPSLLYSSGGTPAPDPAPQPPGSGTRQGMNITVHFIHISESEAFEILKKRRSAGGDTALLADLIRLAGEEKSGIEIAATLTGSWETSGASTLSAVREVTYYPEGRTPRIMRVGSSADIQAALNEEENGCGIHIQASHHFAEPLLYPPRQAQADPERPAPPGTEFREVIIETSVRLKPGTGGLIQYGQLPRLPDDPPDRPPRRLFTFVSVQSAAPS